MADIHSSYGGGSLNVDTKAPGVSFNQSNSGLSGMLNNSMAWKQAMAEREMRMREQEGADRAAQAKLQRAGMQRSLAPDMRTKQGPAIVDHGAAQGMQKVQDDLMRARARDEMIQMQAKQGLAPMRGVHGFNMIGSAGGRDTLDPGEMNAYQRQAFMPQGSGFSGLGGPVATGSIQSPNIQHGGGSQSNGQDPYHNGTGRAFANEQMLGALKRSNSEFDQRNPGLGK